MATTSNFRNGLCIVHHNALYTIVEFQHVKPGKGGAFVRSKLKNLATGRVIENTFNAGVKVETARIERRSYQFLYKDSDTYHMMDQESFEQVEIPESIIDAPKLLKEGQEVTVLFHQELNQLLRCELPPFVTLRVTYAEPGVKGDTVTRALQSVILETGVKIQVPLFVREGDLLRVDTRTSAYAERVKDIPS